MIAQTRQLQGLQNDGVVQMQQGGRGKGMNVNVISNIALLKKSLAYHLCGKTGHWKQDCKLNASFSNFQTLS